MKRCFYGILSALLMASTGSYGEKSAESARPNILWIFAEDLSPYLGCYGDPVNAGHTPVIDQLAERGVRFERAYMPAPVCSACRSAMITGVWQTSIGAQNHTSSRSPDGTIVPEEMRIHLPEGMKTVPELMRQAGYFTFNSGKDDYNFHYDRRALYSTGTKEDYQAGMNGWYGNNSTLYGKSVDAPWKQRTDKTQPWFGQYTLHGGKGGTKYVREGELLPDGAVPLPPYFPDTPAHQAAWTLHYNAARGTDVEVEEVLALLQAEDQLQNTIIFFFSDHGNNQSLRHKQFCYEGGVHVPLIVAGNHPALKSGSVCRDLVSGLDISATTLALGGAMMPSYLSGQNLFGTDYKAKDYILSARDRCDFTTDRIRTVRSDQFRYIRNYYPERTMLQPAYRDKHQTVKDLKRLHAEGALTDYQEAHWFGPRPVEELYDMAADPHQMNNLASSPEYSGVLKTHRKVLEQWERQTGDQGAIPESQIQLKSNYIRWKDKSVFKNAGAVPEYELFK